LQQRLLTGGKLGRAAAVVAQKGGVSAVDGEPLERARFETQASRLHRGKGVADGTADTAHEVIDDALVVAGDGAAERPAVATRLEIVARRRVRMRRHEEDAIRADRYPITCQLLGDAALQAHRWRL
jgi:hypothetical protein